MFNGYLFAGAGLNRGFDNDEANALDTRTYEIDVYKRQVYNRAVDNRMASYVPNLFRSVYTGTRADHKRALCDEDMKKVFAGVSSSSAAPVSVRRSQELFILMFLLRGLPFVDLAYLRKSDLRDNVITYRRRKTGRPLSVTLTPEAMAILKKYMSRDDTSPYLFPLLKSCLLYTSRCV